MPHHWLEDERDALQMMFHEYDMNTAREVDVYNIFRSMFHWTGEPVPPLSGVRDQWRCRWKLKRTPLWANHSQNNINAYTGAQQVRRAAVRVRLLAAANHLHIHLAPIPTAAALHAVALAQTPAMGAGMVPQMLAVPTNAPPTQPTSILPPFAQQTGQAGAPAANQKAVASSNAPAASPVLQAPTAQASQPRTRAERSTRAKHNAAPPIGASSMLPPPLSAPPVASRATSTPPDTLRSRGMDMFTGARKAGYGGGNSAKDVGEKDTTVGASKSRKRRTPQALEQPASEAPKNSLGAKRPRKDDLVRQREEAQTRQQSTNRVEQDAQSCVGHDNTDQKDDENNGDIQPDSNAVSALPKQKQLIPMSQVWWPSKVQMVHSKHMYLATDPNNNETRIQGRVEYSDALVLQDSAVYNYGGVVKDAWFFDYRVRQSGIIWASKFWRPRTVMMCDTSICSECNPAALPEDAWEASPTNGLGFVHTGRDCSVNSSGVLIHHTFGIERKTNRDHDHEPQDEAIEKYIPEACEEKDVHFGAVTVHKMMVGAPNQCSICREPQQEEDIELADATVSTFDEEQDDAERGENAADTAGGGGAAVQAEDDGTEDILDWYDWAAHDRSVDFNRMLEAAGIEGLDVEVPAGMTERFMDLDEDGNMVEVIQDGEIEGMLAKKSW